MPDPDRPTVHVTSPTEGRNPRTVDIDQLPIMDVLRRINNEDALVAAAVAEALPAVAAVVELAVASLTVGGRVHYVGAGTSGRIAMLDAVEISQTYGVPKDWFLAHHAGGLPALGELLEDVEDDETAGAMDTADVQRGDVVVGLSASGRSPYVLGALRQARLVGASAVLVSGDPAAEYGSEVDVHVAVSTGPEALTGSTRLKAATAQKMVLNAISTATMIRLGFTYSNLMVGLLPTNAKLRGRALGVLMAAAGEDEPTCAGVLAEAGGDVRVALVMLLRSVPASDARAALDAARGVVREALG